MKRDNVKGDNRYPEEKLATFLFSFPLILIRKFMQNWIYIFLSSCVIFLIFLLLSLYQLSTVDVFLFVLAQSPTAFSLCAFFLAISTFFFSLLNVGIALISYQIRENECRISWRDIPYTSKYGARDRIIPGKGRYDLSKSRICYSVFCNLTGTFAAWGMYIFLRSFPDFSSFVCNGNFANMANLDLLFSLLLTLVQNFFLFTREPMTEFKENEENLWCFPFVRRENVAVPLLFPSDFRNLQLFMVFLLFTLCGRF